MEKEKDNIGAKVSGSDKHEKTGVITGDLESDGNSDDLTGKKQQDFFNYESKTTLQSKFESFRNRRLISKKQALDLKQKSALKRTDKNSKQNLREKFIETAKKYYGTPYQKRFHKEGSEHYNSKLFLDCCGLVRRVVWDLREEFGFTLLPYNQNYQFETLPIALEFHEMKPGDLIFYEGTYYPHFHGRYQHHNLVHVEIFIGGDSGEQSIGARWHSGFVQLHDSYKFESKNYHSVKHYFRSLDTWLDGVCK